MWNREPSARPTPCPAYTPKVQRRLQVAGLGWGILAAICDVGARRQRLASIGPARSNSVCDRFSCVRGPSLARAREKRASRVLSWMHTFTLVRWAMSKSRRLSATSYIMHLLMNQRSLQSHDTTCTPASTEDGLPAARLARHHHDMGRSAHTMGRCANVFEWDLKRQAWCAESCLPGDKMVVLGSRPSGADAGSRVPSR